MTIIPQTLPALPFPYAQTVPASSLTHPQTLPASPFTYPQTVPVSPFTHPQTLPATPFTHPQTPPASSFTHPQTLLALPFTYAQTLPASPFTHPQTLPASSLIYPQTVPASPFTHPQTLPASSLTHPQTLPASLLTYIQTLPASPFTFAFGSNVTENVNCHQSCRHILSLLSPNFQDIQPQQVLAGSKLFLDFSYLSMTVEHDRSVDNHRVASDAFRPRRHGNDAASAGRIFKNKSGQTRPLVRGGFAVFTQRLNTSNQSYRSPGSQHPVPNQCNRISASILGSCKSQLKDKSIQQYRFFKNFLRPRSCQGCDHSIRMSFDVRHAWENLVKNSNRRAMKTSRRRGTSWWKARVSRAATSNRSASLSKTTRISTPSSSPAVSESPRTSRWRFLSSESVKCRGDLLASHPQETRRRLKCSQILKYFSHWLIQCLYAEGDVDMPCCPRKKETLNYLRYIFILFRVLPATPRRWNASGDAHSANPKFQSISDFDYEYEFLFH
ncbi:unnamed protein product, partial [Nesidiocoris tenuis]